MSSACDSCPHASGCNSQDSCPSVQAELKNSVPGIEKAGGNSKIKAVIGVASGKGGVGKSFVTTKLAVELARKGYKTGILDADVTGPSIPRAFGLHERLLSTAENMITPVSTKSGIKAVSLNLILDDEEAPVVWRGPVISGLVKQFWTDVDWGTLDVLLIDMPPGTGDVPLTVFQSIPIDGLVLVSTPQDLVSMIVNKARNMASMMKVPVLGMVENMSFIKCPHCGDEIRLYGDGSSIEKSAAEIGSKVTDRLPLDPEVTKLVDSGNAEKVSEDLLSGTTDMIIKLIEK